MVATGVFDVLHPGHVRFLTWAASQGLPLYVGVEADGRVAAWKGPGRPVNTLAERAELLVALKAVAAVFAILGDPAACAGADYVTLLAQLSPAAIAFSAGDPHRDSKRAAADALGAEAWEFSHQPGYSTTNLITRFSSLPSG